MRAKVTQMEHHPNNPFIGSKVALAVEQQEMHGNWEKRFAKDAELILEDLGRHMKHLTIYNLSVGQQQQQQFSQNISRVVASALKNCQNLQKLDLECYEEDNSNMESGCQSPNCDLLLPPDLQIPSSLQYLYIGGTPFLLPLQDALLENSHGQLAHFRFYYWNPHLYSTWTWASLQTMHVNCELLLTPMPWSPEQLHLFFTSLNTSTTPNLQQLTIACINRRGYLQCLLETTHNLPKLAQLNLQFLNTDSFHGFQDDIPKGIKAASTVMSLSVQYSHAACFQDFGYLRYFPGLKHLTLQASGPECYQMLGGSKKQESVKLWNLIRERKTLYLSNVWKVLPLLKQLELDWKPEVETPAYKQVFTHKGYQRFLRTVHRAR